MFFSIFQKITEGVFVNQLNNWPNVLSCQPRVTLTSCFVYNFISDLESLDHLCINPIHRIGLIHKQSIDSG